MSCWSIAPLPSERLLRLLKAGNFPPDTIARLRRDRLLRPAVLIGTGTCGLGAGAGKTLDAARRWLVEHSVEADLVNVGCIGLCSEEPLLDVQLPGRTRLSFSRVTADQVPALLEAVFAGQVPPEFVLGQLRGPDQEPWPEVRYLEEHPFLRPQLRWVLANAGIIDPASIDEYIARGGYSALEQTLRQHTPAEVCELVAKSGLKGRGGAGFLTGLKWKLAREPASETKYLICNADEGDPGAFMDRAVAESDPHRLLEGMIVAAYAIGAHKAYIYIRAEYPLAIERLRAAITQATAYGLLGHDVLGSGFELDIAIKMGAGAFVCGEETALMHSIEGKRGMPRPRPPYPAAEGLFGKPTIINNVETLANVPSVMAFGPEGFASVGTDGSKGTKVFALSGMVSRTGLVEVPMGTTLRQIVFDAGGGIPGGKRCKAVQIGGPSGGCIPEAHLDLPTDYQALQKFGTIMGSGGLVVLDESTCMVDLAKYFMEFIQSESCGKCIPCREGTRRLLEMLQAITRPRRKEEGLDALLRFQGGMHLKELGEVIHATSLCGLGHSAPNPVLSTLRWFRDEYEAHIFDRTCPAGTCKELVGAPCQTGCPVGTEVWRYVAHVARGEYEQAYKTIRDANPFPSICARVCHHPCETVCRCGTTGADPIAVRALKRFVVDRIDPSGYVVSVPPAPSTAKRVAVIGAGPAGLSAAHYLSLRGRRVTLFEQQSEPGGMLLTGIPAYRLPRELVRREIAALMNANVELRCGVKLGRDLTVDGLLAQGFDAVYVAIGAYQSHRLGLPGEDLAGVIPGMEFLQAHNLRGETLARGRVGVVGGGNTAIDAARVALRQPGVDRVTLLYRRDRSEMPAHPEEVRAALEEGVELLPLVAPVALSSAGGRLAGVRLIRNRLGEPDAGGRRRPIAIAGSEFDQPLDTLIVAISEQPDAGALAGLRTSKSGTLEVNRESTSAGLPGVFGGGDAIRGPSSVIEAIADGKRAALMIDRYLRGEQLRLMRKVRLPTVYLEPIFDEEGGEHVAARATEASLPVEQRRQSFAEVELGLTESAAVTEARRCLRCDLEFTRPAV